MTNKIIDCWQEKKLKDISDITSSKRIYEWEYVSSGIPFYRGKEITALKSKQKIDDFIYISEARYNELKEKYGVPNKGDILITAVGTIGNAYTIENSKPFYFKDGNLLWVKNIKEHPKFLEYLFENNKKLFLGNSFGSSQHALTISKLENLSFYFPPLDEQKRIASTLSKIDAYLENTIKLIEEKERFKKGIAKKLLTCKKGENIPEARFKEFNDECDTVMLGNILSYEQPQNYIVKSEEYDNKNKYPVLTAGKTFILGYTNEEFGIYDKLPVIIFDDFTTDAKYVDFPFKVKSSAIKILKSKCYDTKLIYELMKNIKFNARTHKRYYLSEYQYLKIKIPKSIKEQEDISKFLSLLDAEIDNLKKQEELIKEMKKGMINKLMSGEVRL